MFAVNITNINRPEEEMKSIITKTVLFFAVFLTATVKGTVIEVPGNYSSIQQAINAATDGDTVLVSPGRYFENINFHGKNILVTSYFMYDSDVSYISNTVIDGSQPAHPDTASCVLIVSGEDSTAVLQGFTLIGGTGTKWIDEHGAGTYVEGGGILIAFSSPTIKNNLLINNEAISSPSGTLSAGGGAMRCGDGSPKILNNVIINNKGMYGGGIVLNYCSDALIKNNIITANKVFQAVPGKQTFGGGGIWILETLPGNDLPNILENNTITSNSSNSIGGGVRIWTANATLKNNIVWNNFQEDNTQIHISGSNTLIEYNNVENGIDGTGNITVYPSFADSSFYLNDDSPCIDSGDPALQYNDPEDSNSPGNALFPSKGTIRNDIGAYGGAMSFLFSDFSSAKFYVSNQEYNFGLNLPGESVSISIPVTNSGSAILNIDSIGILVNNTDITVQNSFPIILHPISKDELILTWTPLTQQILQDTLLIYHNDSNLTNPYKVSLIGDSHPNALLFFDAAIYNYGDIDVNIPRIDTTLYVHNYGTIPDSVYTSIIYQMVNPDSSLELTPAAFEIGPKDSVGITFTIYPPQINRTGFNIYKPKIVIDSRFSIGTTHFEKIMQFHLVGTTGLDEEINTPLSFNLSQNYPNPFNPSTRIQYAIDSRQFVSLKVYDILGKEVATLVNEEKSVGTYEQNWNAANLPSGVYFYHLQAGDYVETKKMVLLK